MSLRTLLITGAAAFVLSGSAALAADLPAQPVEPVMEVPSLYNWNGFYVGAQIGYAWADADIEFDRFDDVDLNAEANGVVGGLFVGYNVQFNQIVVGLEADIEATNISGDDHWDNGNEFWDTDNDSNWQGSIRARLGYAFDNFLPYIQGGVAFLDRDVSLRFRNDDVRVEDSDTLTGWTVGLGAEYGFTPNLTARIEYRYTDYGSSDFHFDSPNIDRDVNADLTTNAVRVGIAYKF